MKYNQWTLGLAALGVVSLASVAQAEEKMSAVQSALSSTTISGYVDTSAQWNPGTGTGANYYRFSEGKADGFNLNVVQLTIAKPLDEAEWAAGYRADLWFGPDANTLNTSSTGSDSDLAIRQAYVVVRTPLGNGLDWKLGVFDNPIGYESLESGNNPNFTRSYGSSLEPTTLTGLQLSYRFCDAFSVSGGIANTVGPTINDRANPPMAESYKTYFGTVALTAPESWGFLKGSSLYFGVLNGYASMNGLPGTPTPLNGPNVQTSWYVGSTIATPLEGFKLGFAWDVLNSYDGSAGNSRGQYPGATYGNGNDAWAAAVYASYQATEKLSFHGRAEVVTYDNGSPLTYHKDNSQIYSLTGTVQYDLWKNVISRLEVRWDHSDEGKYFSGSDGPYTQVNAVMLAANVIYKF